jgi:hypothetical protein
VFVASTVSGDSDDSSANSSRLRSGSSGAASITRSQPARPSSAATAIKRATAASGSSRRPFSAILARPPRT